jgi:hypothetical protein
MLMSQARNIAVVVGSLRKDSVNRKLAKAFAALPPAHLKFDFVDIGDLPHFDQDLETEPPAEWVAFRKRVARADGMPFGGARSTRQNLVSLRRECAHDLSPDPPAVIRTR